MLELLFWTGILKYWLPDENVNRSYLCCISHLYPQAMNVFVMFVLHIGIPTMASSNQ